ncbi:EscU/YscU/HrcU family type III secretion system export apparatus switch protein [Lentisphaerota bacterium WC36G]|nr:EscU/YscU/HrcU family type III secretion system export apparatus switch protein [Lentisphaerae bacterium WC36]
MANKDPSKTEKPTQKRIKKARQDEGNVLVSPDIISLAVLIGGVLMMLYVAPALKKAFTQTFFLIQETDCRKDFTYDNVARGFSYGLSMFTAIMAPFFLGVITGGIAGAKAQIGSYFSLAPVKWKFEMKFKKGFMEMLPNKQNVINLTLTIAKCTVVGFIAYFAVKGNVNELMETSMKPVGASLKWSLLQCFFISAKIIAVFVVLAATDYVFKRKKYYEDLMMSKQDIKDEHRNAEGDQFVKARVKQKMRELLRNRMMQELPEATVVIANPIHVAVALKYSHGDLAPKVVAKGLRKRALLIKKIAKDNGVPIVEAPPLARSLYRNSNIFEFIDEKFFSAVAAILANLQTKGKKRF